MTVIHLKKKDVVKSKVRGVKMEFDHEQLATILGVPGTNGICEYIKDVWEESKYTKPLEITRRFANDENIMATKEGQIKQAVEGESGSGERFYDAEDMDQGSPEVQEEIPATTPRVRLSRRNRLLQESTPRVLLAEFLKL
ncbi:hypothetical protein Dimus_000935 [Dionaea muscipula]